MCNGDGNISHSPGKVLRFAPNLPGSCQDVQQSDLANDGVHAAERLEGRKRAEVGGAERDDPTKLLVVFAARLARATSPPMLWAMRWTWLVSAPSYTLGEQLAERRDTLAPIEWMEFGIS